MATKSVKRRDFLQGMAALGAGTMLGFSSKAVAEPPPETETIRLYFDPQIPVMCWASQYVAKQFLYLEGFAQVDFVASEGGLTILDMLSAGGVDISAEAIASWVGQIDGGAEVVVLSGMHPGCFEIVGNDRIRSIRDLKHKRVAAISEGNGDHLLMSSVAAYIGIDPRRDIDWVYASPHDWVGMFEKGEVDAIGTFPEMSYHVRARGLGHVILNTTVDKPWRNYFCCMIGGNNEFVRRHPIATKRALRAILKASELCSREPERTARWLVEKGYASHYEYTVQTLREIQYGAWRSYSPEDTMRFFALRLHDVEMIRTPPNDLIARGTNWRFLNELKKELKA